MARARAVANEVESGNVHLPGRRAPDGSGYERGGTEPWVQGLVDECAAFPNGAHDDQVDALSQALRPGAGDGYRQKRLGPGLMAGIMDRQF